MATTSDDTGSNVLLIVIAVILAIGAAIYFMNYAGRDAGTDVSINADLPSASRVTSE